ncbi:MAG: transposase [Treponema sp.]|jgi:hypothetical protein|nr:transposase [Treponema sp.]
MSHIYWELNEIPIPEGAYINHNDGRVFLIDRGIRDKEKRQVIGRATGERTMHPNDLFKFLYPALWNEHYTAVRVPEHALHTGFYALSLGVGYKSGLYPLLHEVYGPLYANMIMDYANYSILERSDVSQLYRDRMSHEVLFSRQAFSDSWLSEFFEMKISEDQNHQFRIGWLDRCREAGVTRVWLSIDGTNIDCAAQRSELPQKGHAKSRKNTKVVSCIYAVSTESGLPITYFVRDGSVTDGKAFTEIAQFLAGAGIKVEGVILDRCFCSHNVISRLTDIGYPYVVMLRSDTYGHMSMMERYAAQIRWNVRRCVGEEGLFGIHERTRLFKGYPQEANVSLFYDGANGSARSIALIRKITTAAKDLEQQIAASKKPTVPAEMKKYLSVVNDEGVLRVDYNYGAWQKDVDQKGYSSVASSADIDAAQADRIYHLRDASEKQFSIMKSQLGYDAVRVHYSQGIENKFAVCFIAGIIRSEIMSACRKLELDTNRMLHEIDRISLVLMPDGTYTAINDLTGRQKQLLAEFGVRDDAFTFFAGEVNRRMLSPISSQVHILPGQSPDRKKGRPPKQKEAVAGVEEQPKRKPGRPKGSRNKSTASQTAPNKGTGQPPRRRGRPSGSKNKPKPTEALPGKRRRGRPRKQDEE